MAEEKKQKQEVQEVWGVGWTEGTATVAPERVVINTQEGNGYDLLAVMATILNNQEKLKKLLV
jgi:hypothetical protein